jgi:DNA polymerase IV
MTAPEPPSNPSSQGSLQVKLSRKQILAQDSQRTDVISVKDSFPPPSIAQILPGTLEDHISDSSPPPHADIIKEKPTLAEVYGDALSEAIQTTKAISHLPIDEDESDAPSSPLVSPANTDSDPEYGTDVEFAKPILKQQRTSADNVKRDTGKGFDQSAYQCMQPNQADASPSIYCSRWVSTTIKWAITGERLHTDVG